MGNKATLAAYTFGHFSVDFSCFFLLFAGFAAQMPDLQATTLGFLLYNMLAFGLQPVFGSWCDARPRFPAAALGCLLLLAALACLPFAWPSLVLAGLGNALFHVGGGIDSLAGANGRMARSGVFVSSGALGVALGTLAGQAGAALLWLPLALTLLSLVGAGWAWRQASASKQTFNAFFGAAAAIPAAAVLALCLASIIIRAYGGGLVPLPWRTTALLRVLPGAAAFLGKAVGGFLADALGARTVGVVTLLLSIPLLFFSDMPAAAVLGLLLFNINMPITLCAVSSVLPESPGLSFGLTTLGLLLGTVPLFFFELPQGVVRPVVAVLTGLSALGLLLAVKNQNRHKISALRVPQNESEVLL
ncbi:MAG: hypothetical protein AB7V55_08580 [Oscillospiraceae bacterium]